MQGIDIDGLDAHFITCAADSLAYFNFQDRKLLYTQSLPEKGADSLFNLLLKNTILL